MSALLLGIDVGTSVIKAAVYAPDGREVAVESQLTQAIRLAPGWSELDPDATWRAVAETCRRLLGRHGLAGTDVAAVGVTGVMVGAWLIDADGAPVRRAILWDDTRARDLVRERADRAPTLLGEVFASSGSVMQLGCTVPVLAWLARHEPEALARASAVLGAKDFVRLRLTGAIGTDETEAAVAPGSARERGFAPAILDLFEIGALRRLLPLVHASASLAGTVTAEAAAATGLRAGTPVAFGAGDTPACVIGAGAGAPGTAVSVLGTTCLNGVVLDAPSFHPPDLGLLFSVPGGLWMKTMVNVAGTTNIDWCLRALCPDLAAHADRHARLEHLAEAAGVGAGGVTYVPYLNAGGIIAPRIEAGARGAFVGLEPRHERSHLVRALYEGVALAVRDCFAAIDRPVAAIRLSGGGAGSAFWSQMIADVVGATVEVPAGTQFGAKGAALLAGVAVGHYGSVAAACRDTFRLARRHDPRPDRHAAYADIARRFATVSAGSLDAIAPAYR